MALHLSVMVNKSMESGHLPTAMTIVKFIPLYKTKEIELMSNYRPISILPTMSNILERAIYNRLFKFLISNNVLFPSSMGFLQDCHILSLMQQQIRK